MAYKTISISPFLDIGHHDFQFLFVKTKAKTCKCRMMDYSIKTNSHYPDVCHFAAAVLTRVKQNVPALVVFN